MNKEKIIKFAAPFYEQKDLMHNLSHIELVIKYIDKIISWGDYQIDYDKIIIAAYLHGFIYSHELEIRTWLEKENFSTNDINEIITLAYESQKDEEPITLAGKILHDAHMIEGGETYLLTKSLLTGTARGQSLQETIKYIEDNVIDKGKCYLPETIPIHEKANLFAKNYASLLKKDLK